MANANTVKANELTRGDLIKHKKSGNVYCVYSVALAGSPVLVAHYGISRDRDRVEMHGVRAKVYLDGVQQRGGKPYGPIRRLNIESFEPV